MSKLSAVEALSTVKEICDEELKNGCKTCCIRKLAVSFNTSCRAVMIEHPKELIELVTKYREEHPVKTYADHFFKIHPNAKRYKYDRRLPDIPFDTVYGGSWVDNDTDTKLWLQPYKEDTRND